MDAAVGVERRRAARLTNGLASVRARLLPGLDLEIVDLSSVGVCVRSRLRLLPGSRVIVQLAGPPGVQMIRSRVIRCQVCALGPGREIGYCGALGFEDAIEKFVNALPATGNPFPGASATAPPAAGYRLPAAAGTEEPAREIPDE